MTDADKLIAALQHQVATLEQELRETVGELEKAQQEWTVQWAEAERWRDGLSEATALLEIIRELAPRVLHEAQNIQDSRAPAQPAAPTSGAPAASSAVKPGERPGEWFARLARIDFDEQPAAPEPSAPRLLCSTHDAPLANEAFFKCGCRYLSPPLRAARRTGDERGSRSCFLSAVRDRSGVR